MQNPYHIEKQHLRERGIDADGNYTNEMGRSEEHTSELQSRLHLVCRLLLEKKKTKTTKKNKNKKKKKKKLCR